MTTSSSLRAPRPTPVRVATLALTLTLAGSLSGCGILGDWLGGKSDYQAGAQRTQPLDVPPDLTQLQRDSRYLPQGGVVAASDLGKPGAPVSAATQPTVAVATLGDLHVERSATGRVLVSARAPEVLWPAVRQFWIDKGFKIAEENSAAGFLETDWADSKIKRPHGLIQDTLGKVVDGLFDSGYRDRYRTRLERSATGGTEITISQFGLQEETTGWQKDGTKWVPRPNDPGLEAEMMQLMMVTLGASPEAARTAVAASPAASGAAAVSAGSQHAKLLEGQPSASLQVDDGFDRAWRRVGLALDHGGFTVEDRDRAQGTYYVRFVDAKEASKDDPNILTKAWDYVFGDSSKSPVGKYRIKIVGEANRSTISMLDNTGKPANDDNAKRIVARLLEELK